MKISIAIAGIILGFLLFKPVMVEGYYDAQAEAAYKSDLLTQFKAISGGKPIDDKSPPAVQIKMMAAWLVSYNKYAKSTGAKPAVLDQAPVMFPQSWLEEYNASVSKK